MNSAASSPRPRKRSNCWTFSLAATLAILLVGPGAALAASDKRDPSDDIKITGRDNGLIQEFRLGGRIYMIKIAPRYGVPYYLIDSNGDGSMDTRKTEVDEHIMIPSWTLLRWK